MSFGLTAGDWANAAADASRKIAAPNRTARAMDGVNMPPPGPLLDPLVFVLALRAGVDRNAPVLPAVVPLLALPRLGVGLALVLALLVFDHLRTLAAAGQPDHRDAR